ncbi:MAG: exosortase/archaeosortase family protein [Planctomycetaceae bacterium]|nr:MAG: exosortase/archaeosortase family protein [Planctomycetaceae bacterium]
MNVSRLDKERGDLYKLAAVVFALLVVAAWAYWPIMSDLFQEWQNNDDYSAGQLVPAVAAFLVWRERKTLSRCALHPCWWGGVTLLLLAGSGRAYGLLFLFESAERYSLVLSIAGLVLMVAGWRVFRCTSWILLFLFLMVPLPGRIHNMVGGPLQSLATTGSVFLLEVSGVRVSQQGNIMMLNRDVPLAVAEACSGLRMLMAFVIVAAFIAYMVKRPRFQKVVVLVSSIAVGVMCNIVRIFATAIFMLLGWAEQAEKFFHDSAGLVMMPIAVLLIFGELWLMKKLTMPEPGPSQGQAGP